MNTWPFSFIRVTKIFRGSHEHLSVAHWRPERHHVIAPVVTDGGIFFRIHSRICQEIPEVSPKAIKQENVKVQQELFSKSDFAA